jgi:hypothetical protein
VKKAGIATLVVIVCVAALMGLAFGGEQQMKDAGSEEARLRSVVEANITATHAYQVLLAKNKNRGDEKCWGAQGVSDETLAALIEHQKAIVAMDPQAVKAWVKTPAKASPSPAKDLAAILAVQFKLADDVPVNVLTNYFMSKTKATRDQARALASLLQMMLDIDRDGDVLQQEFALYTALGLPVYIRQIGLAGETDADFLAMGKELSPKMCASPFDTDPATLQMMFRKLWNWGQRYTGERDKYVLARELLGEPDIAVLVPKIKAMPPQKIAVIGHSFTMNVHWASPSAFVPIATEMIRKYNPTVEVRQWEGGGLTPTRAYNNFYKDALAWKPNKVLFVVIPRKEEDYQRLEEMCKGFAAQGAKVYMFDSLHDPEDRPERNEQIDKIAADTGLTIIEVGQILHDSPDKDRFIALDKIHMTEPYHRLMAKEWLRFLIGARGAALGAK